MMIDLKMKFVRFADCEIYELFMDECERQLITWCNGSEKPRDWKSACSPYVCINPDGNLQTLSLNDTRMPGYKELTLADLKPAKPRAKVEYVKCEFDHKWEAVKFMEETEESLYINPNDEYIEVMVCESAIKKMRQGVTLYRRVEREVTWQEELNDAYPAIDFNDLDSRGSRYLGDWQPDSFIKMCHLVASMTGKPE